MAWDHGQKTNRSLAHLSRRLTRWTYRMGLEPASVCVFTLQTWTSLETSGPIAIKFYLKHHGGGKATWRPEISWIGKEFCMPTFYTSSLLKIHVFQWFCVNLLCYPVYQFSSFAIPTMKQQRKMAARFFLHGDHLAIVVLSGMCFLGPF